MKQKGQYLRSFQRKLLERELQTDLRIEYRRRIEIMLLADEGYTQVQICASLGCTQETARYWLAQAQAGQAQNWRNQPIGRPKVTNKQYLDRLQELVSDSPREHGYSFQNWTGHWLSKHLAKELGITVSARHVNRLLKKMGLSTRSKTTEKELATAQANQDRIDSRLKISKLSSPSKSRSPEFWQLISLV